MKNVNTGYMIRAPTGGRTAQTLTTEYRRAAELTQRGDTAFLICTQNSGHIDYR